MSRRCLMLLVLGMVTNVTQADVAELARGAELLSPLKRDMKQALVAGLEVGDLRGVYWVEFPATAQ